MKVGASYDYSRDLTLRIGYNHAGQPIPSAQTFFNILAPGVVQDHLTLGATWKTPSGGELSLSYAHAFKKQIDGSNSMQQFGGGNANISMQQNLVGMAYSWNL